MLQEEQSATSRYLTAVVFADVAGFSRLMADDDIGTTRRWEELRRTVLIPLAARFGGRLAEFAGDAILMAFPSVVGALNWAIEVQGMHDEQPQTNLSDLQLRFAINVEDVVIDGDHMLGDGINIASRIHQAANPGQIVITGLARELVGNRVAVHYRDLGTPRLKNINRIVHLYAAEPMDGSEDPILHHPYLEWTSRPAVAVLPFRCGPGDSADEYFGSGITEDIITGLSRSRTMHVIARASTLRFVERTDDIRDIAAQLGVNYVLDGSVRRQKDVLRISAQLVSVAENRSIWAEHFDGSTQDIFDFQDSIVTQVVASLELRLRAAETARVRSRPTASLDAYDCVLKAASQLYDFSDDSFRLSGLALERALTLDPDYAQAHAFSGWRLNFLIGEERSTDPVRDRARAFDHARRAIALDPGDAFSQVVAAHLTSFVAGRPTEAMTIFDTALSIDENSALGWAMSGITMSYLGHRDDAMKRFRNAFKLSPFDWLNFSWWCGAGMAEFVGGDYPAAASWLHKAHTANPRYAATLRMLAATLALDGNDTEARAVAQQLLALDSTFSVDRFMSWYPLARDEDKTALREGLLLAGLPA
ncbi:MAG: adenylate cyclase [Rhodobacteraceae bacterium]|nr:adenylate cyclase [Paracoccaceae bacterium]